MIENPEEYNALEIYKDIVESSPNGVIVIDEDFLITLYNSTAEKITGIKREEVIGNHFHSYFPQIELSDVNNKKDDKIDIISLNGKDIQIKVFTAKNRNGRASTICLMQDISQVIRLTAELERSKHVIEELEEILEASFDGFLVTDGEGNVLMVNQSYYRVTGIEKVEMMGKNMRDLMNPLYMKNSVAFLVIEEKRPMSLHHSTRNGRNVMVTGTPIFDKKGNISKIVINVRDISEIYELRQELLNAREMEKVYFSNISNTTYKKGDKGSIVVVSEKMQDIFLLAKRVSAFDTTVLISGESGVGKEEIAKYIHNNSLRKNKPFVVINCGAIPEQLLESELFGYEKGAFTGATKEGKTGLFEAADGGTLFLDEIGEMPLNLQVKLLRVLEAREITKVGSVKPIKVDIRLLAATNKNIEKKVNCGEFREDLFYRLNVIQIKIPPLRERVNDIAPLALHFLQTYNHKYGQSKKITYDVIKELEGYTWHGNIRQLKNMIENMVIVSNNEYLQVNDLPWYKQKLDLNETEKNANIEIMPLQLAVEQLERRILKKAQEVYRSTRKIAQVVQMDQSTVVRKLKKYGLSFNDDVQMHP